MVITHRQTAEPLITKHPDGADVVELSAVPIGDRLRLGRTGEVLLVCVPGRRRAPRAAIALASVLHYIRAGRLTVDVAAAAVGRDPHLSRPLNELWSSHKLAPLVGRVRLADGRKVMIVAVVSERLDRCRLQLCLEEALAEATGSGPA